MIRVVALANLPGHPRGTARTVDESPLVLALIRKGRLAVESRVVVDETPPRGTVTELMRWIGDDEDRAYAVLDVELASTAPRQTLIRRIDTLLGVAGVPQSVSSAPEALAPADEPDGALEALEEPEEQP